MAPPLQWRSTAFEKKEKSADWFWALGIIAVALVVTALMLQNVLFAAVILLSALALALNAVKNPSESSFEINDRGILIDQKFYPYSTLDSFGIDTDIPPKLVVKSQKVMMPYLIIPIEEEHIPEIQGYLLLHLDEEGHREPLSQKLMEYLGF